MSQPPTPFQSWRGMVLSFRDDTELERAFVDGILHVLARFSDPEYDKGLPTAEQVEWIVQGVDERRATADAKKASELGISPSGRPPHWPLSSSSATRDRLGR